jgi:RNA polymerase sigma factor for flagellar operon FliA
MNAEGAAIEIAQTERADVEAALWRELRHTGSTNARERLFSLHFDFARQIARRQWLDRRSGDVELQDLCQLAAAGLLETIDRYDPELGTPFTAYARRRIAGSVLDGLSKMSEVREQISFRNRTRAQRARSLAVPKADDLPAEEALRALTELAVGLAIGFMLDDAGVYVADGERDRRANAYDSLVWKETVGRLAAEVSRLPERERLIIRHHYMDGLTFEQIGAVLGLTKGRISQMHQTAIALLRKRLRNGGDFKLER